MVQERIAQAATRGISGVPFFILNGRYGMSGAQPADSLASAFDKLVSDTKS